MQPELRQFMGTARYHKASVRRVAEMLPTEDAALDELITEIVAAANQTEFIYVVMAALSTGRPVSVRHLPRGAMLMPHWLFLGWIAWHMTGELPEPLLDALQHTQLARDVEATALYVIAAWCQQHRNGVMPDGVLAAARALARIKSAEKTGLPHMIQMTATLRALAALTQDAALTAIMLQNQVAPSMAGVKKFMAETLGQFYGDAGSWVLPDAPANTLAVGTTMRRSVARIGRNDPCPCGSGKKYKHCCHDKDQERLHHSSEVAGKTREEVEASPEQHLTDARLDKTTGAEMLRLEPRKIPKELVVPYIMRLCGFSLFDRLAEAFEQRDHAEDLNEVWNFALFHVMRSGRRDILERIIRWRPDAAENEKQLHPGARLLLAQGDPARYLERLEELSLEALQTEDSETLEKFAYGVMVSTRLKALGIFVSRSMLPLLKQRESSFLFNQILEARDKLNLSPDDPFGDIVDRRFANHEVEKESAELRKARQSLGVKAQEVRELKDTMERLQKEIVRREKKSNAPAPVVQVAKPAPVDEQALKEMRRKLDELKSALKERHNERNELRRELQKTQSSLEEIQNKSAPVTHDENGGHDTEDSLLLPADAPESQPIRLIEFPKHFSQTLAPLPRHVARAAMIMIGRLAAGDSAAYVGALRLKATPNVMRQRIGSDYRLLFRLWPERMEVIDLINRKDLERRIKTLV
ncbi:MAG TPA: SEC-C metal-binding domain-containing protein [Verrucomicrobiae bacterium]